MKNKYSRLSTFLRYLSEGAQIKLGNDIFVMGENGKVGTLGKSSVLGDVCLPVDYSLNYFIQLLDSISDVEWLQLTIKNMNIKVT